MIVDSPAELGLDRDGPTQASEGCIRMLPLSANTRVSLQQQVTKTMDYMKRNPLRISDLAYTLAIRREHLPHRAFALIGKNNAKTVSSYLQVPTKISDITMIFGGQGAQWPRMGTELLKRNAGFLDDIRSMDSVLQSMRYPPQWTIEGR